ncbi:hypothetical protein BH20VER1_BH20VER1_12650 [soil metagenome]
MEDLNLPPVLKKFPMLKKGLILVTGPTGSGKSTTLAAMMDYANMQRHDHIITVEDPIEFVHRSQNCLVQHREVGVHTRSFAAALRGALREDPDILLVGELRDLETIELALTAAATGHLVFGTLHTSSAAKAVDRVIDVFPSDSQNQIRATLKVHLGLFEEDVLLKLRTYSYNVVIVYENFKGSTVETNPILVELVKRAGPQRRQHFVVLLSHRFATNDAMSAFVQSVDQIINVSDLTNLKPVLRRGVAQFRELYQPFHETMKAAQQL